MGYLVGDYRAAQRTAYTYEAPRRLLHHPRVRRQLGRLLETATERLQERVRQGAAAAVQQIENTPKSGRHAFR
jgi:hypothetical protein